LWIVVWSIRLCAIVVFSAYPTLVVSTGDETGC
jgi:hypothetical protein